MNEFLVARGGHLDAMYYWEQFQPIIAAIVILLVGWIIALIIAAGIKKDIDQVRHKPKIV